MILFYHARYYQYLLIFATVLLCSLVCGHLATNNSSHNCWPAQELEKDLHGPTAVSLAADKRLAIYDKIFTAYHDVRSCIRNDLVTAGSAENVKDDLNGLDKAASAVLGLRTIEWNQLLVSISKSKLTRSHDDKNEKVTKPEELVRLYDLLLQNVADLSDLVTFGRGRNQEEVVFAKECMLKSSVFRAERNDCIIYFDKLIVQTDKKPQILETARNPELMCEMMRNTDRAMSNIESSPEGFNMLRRMYENVQEPFLKATIMAGAAGNNMNSNPLADLFGTQGAAGGQQRDGSNNPSTAGSDSGAPNTNPLSNPWSNTPGGIQTNSAQRTNLSGDYRAAPLGGLSSLPLLGRLFGGVPDLSSMSQIMQNPAMSQMMQSVLSNPQYMSQIVNMNPQLRAMTESNPQL